MSLAVILEIIAGVLRFPQEVSALIRLLSKSTEEKRQEISDNIQKELKEFQDTGRPS